MSSFYLHLLYTDVPARLAHFTHSVSIFCNSKTQRSLIRGRDTSIHCENIKFQCDRATYISLRHVSSDVQTGWKPNGLVELQAPEAMAKSIIMTSLKSEKYRKLIFNYARL